MEKIIQERGLDQNPQKKKKKKANQWESLCKHTTSISKKSQSIKQVVIQSGQSSLLKIY